MPAVEVDILDEAQPRLIVGDLPDEEGIGIPAVEDVADVEDDGLDCGRGAQSAVIAGEVWSPPLIRGCRLRWHDDGGRQPWRALKRRLVLLMT